MPLRLYVPYSIFPQFLDEQPANGSDDVGNDVHIELTIHVSGTIEENHLNLLVDDESVQNLTLEQIGTYVWKVSSDVTVLDDPFLPLQPH